MIKKLIAIDKRFKLKEGAGSDAVHTNPTYAYAVAQISTDDGPHTGTGLAFTLGRGNELVCKIIEYLGPHIEGKEINELMANFGEVYKNMADDPSLRWLGPQKGVVHLALASVVNACFDLWAKSKGLPLWKLLIDLSPEELIQTLDFSYYEDVLSPAEALDLMKANQAERPGRMQILDTGYPGYDTSVGWFNYSDEKVRENIQKAMESGFTAMKLKVGSAEPSRDIRRAEILRKHAGDQARIMFDANQQWTLPRAIEVCQQLDEFNPFWIEEPTHPDDVMAHVKLSGLIRADIALGEHVPNKVIFKNFMSSGCMAYNQADALRVGGISEYLLISLLSRKYNIPMVPHVGDMGQIHQHLVLVNHIVLGHPVIFLEHIPHLKEYFLNPVKVENGVYAVPQEIGSSSDFKE